MTRTFMDDRLLNWEAYVSGGQPRTPQAARIFFLCLDAPMEPARFVPHDSGDVAAAQRELREMPDDRLRELLARSTSL